MLVAVCKGASPQVQTLPVLLSSSLTVLKTSLQIPHPQTRFPPVIHVLLIAKTHNITESLYLRYKELREETNSAKVRAKLARLEREHRNSVSLKYSCWLIDLITLNPHHFESQGRHYKNTPL